MGIAKLAFFEIQLIRSPRNLYREAVTSSSPGLVAAGGLPWEQGAHGFSYPEGVFSAINPAITDETTPSELRLDIRTFT
jgi:hypothetical protein